QKVAPDLVLLYINMPGMNGYEVIQSLKSIPATADIPVIFISAISEIEDKIKAFEYGGVDYITKPFQLEEVLARVKTQLDLSRQRKMLEKLRERDLARFERINQLKDFVIQSASHDLKNPLSSIKLTADLLQRHRQLSPEKIDQRLQRILNSVDQMQKLITDLLDLARIESGFAKNLETVSVSSFLQIQVDALTPIAEESQITVQLAEIDLAMQALFDPSQIAQVMSNLISNAIKYTPDGGHVQIDAQCINLATPHQLAQNFVALSVKDTGLGIPDEAIPRLFDSFYRVESKAHMAQHGTGLGLAIVKAIVDAHHGSIDVVSEVGVGSCFTVYLPI
ncbi:MAG: hybrid sensor histidine kinase/response regulator, partial [Chloroflexota bacterium]